MRVDGSPLASEADEMLLLGSAVAGNILLERSVVEGRPHDVAGGGGTDEKDSLIVLLPDEGKRG